MRNGRSAGITAIPDNLVIERPRRGPLTDWCRIPDGSHIVQFYADDALLLDRASRYVGSALIGGGSAVVVATEAHRSGIARTLKARGFNINVPRRQGRYLALDAAETLAKITVNGWPDEAALERVIGGALDRVAAAAERPCVSAFGEMVALLCARRRTEAAIRLEQLWNDLADKRLFSLCCAYPMTSFAGEHGTAPFLKICAQHSHVFPAARIA